MTKETNSKEAQKTNTHNFQSISRIAETLDQLLDLEQAHTNSEILQAAHQIVQSNLDFQSIWIYLFAEGSKTAFLLSTRGDMASELADQNPVLQIEGDPFLEEIAEATHIVLVEDARTDPRTDKKIVAQLGNRTIVNVPIILHGKHIGALGMGSFGNEGVKIPNKAQLDFLSAIAGHLAVALDRVRLLAELDQRSRDQTALALENARLYTAERKAHDRIARLQAATQVLSTSLDLPQVLELILSELQRVIPYDSASVQQLKDDYLEIIGGRGFPNLQDLLGIKFDTKRDGNPNRVVMRKRQPVILDNAPAQYSDFHTEPYAQTEIRSWLGVPLIFGDRLIGMLALDKQEAGFYTEDHAQLAQAFAAQAASAIVNAQLYDQLSDYAAQLEKRVEERTSELVNANEQLQELDRLKSKFVSDISHELRTPITNLNLYLDLLERGKQEKKTAYFAILREQAERLTHLIEDILDLSRLDMAANIETKMEPVELNELINSVVDTHRPQAKTSGLQLEFMPHNKPAFILGEHDQLSQVITSLITNSINYTSTGHIWVKCRLDSGRNMICVEVKDTGMGIPAEDLPHIFDRFYRGQKTGQLTIPGTGLGLAIVKESVHQHHGEIEIISEVNSGSTFRIFFPVLNPHRS